jgi:spore coat protein CotH
MSARAQLAGVLTVATVVAVSAGCGSGGDDDAATDRELFDPSVVHNVEVTFDEGDYDAMIDTFAESGEKEWIEATVTIDGETYEQVGLRLKGNSSLMGLRGGGPGGGPEGEGDAAADAGSSGSSETTETTESTESTEDTDTTEAADDAKPTESTESTEDTDTTEAADDAEPTESTEPGDAGGGPPGDFGGMGGANAEEPESLPWLIRLDEFVEGQEHQGYEDIVVRSNGSETSMNEAVALDLLEEAGLASQQASSTSFTVNDRDAVLRLAIENPDDDAWQEANFESEGALYKAESTGDWSYRGDDPADYEEVFDQEGGSDVADLTPLIDFLQFLNESDDATFAAELSERLDVDSFATYLAMMEVVANFDDIDGPGNNAYLWYDVEAEQFTVVPWDLNLAFGAMGDLGGGGMPGGDGSGETPEIPEDFDPSQIPEGAELPGGGEIPEDFDPSQIPGDAEPGGGGFGRSNELVERFHANEDFEALYQEKLTELRESLYGGEVADEILTTWADTLKQHATDFVDEATIDEEAASIAEMFTTE